jgi:cell division transport system ATP-binding protein
MITFSQVCKRYRGGHQALQDVTFTIDAGELVFICGPSGAGKTTLLKLMVAIDKPTSGSVMINEQNIGKLKSRAVPYLRRNFGLVFQDHKLLYDRNVFENVVLPLRIAGFPVREAARRVRAALDKVGLLKYERAMPITLSGGEQQRLCVARAIVNRPSVLIADEPTGNLDAEYGSAIGELFQAFHDIGATVIIATHDPALAAQLKPRVIGLKDGRIAA